MELDEILLELLPDFSFFFQQIDPGRVEVCSPFDEESVWLLDFICKNNLILEKVIVIR